MSEDSERLIEICNARKELRKNTERFIAEVKRIHPENCTPVLYAELQQLCIGISQHMLNLAEHHERAYRLVCNWSKLHNGGVMADWPPELIEELSEGLGDEFKDL